MSERHILTNEKIKKLINEIIKAKKESNRRLFKNTILLSAIEQCGEETADFMHSTLAFYQDTINKLYDTIFKD